MRRDLTGEVPAITDHSSFVSTRSNKFQFCACRLFPLTFCYTTLYICSSPFSDGSCHQSFAVRNADKSSGSQENLTSMLVPSSYLS